MRLLTAALLLILLHTVLRGQSATEADPAFVRRAKRVVVSELDDRLPKVGLEFFLKYESAGMPVSWRVVKCGEEDRDFSTSNFNRICVEADFDRKHSGTASVVISIGNSMDFQVTPAFIGATVTDMGGAPRKVHRLGDLPLELRRRAPKAPKDLPTAVDAVVFPAIPISSV